MLIIFLIYIYIYIFIFNKVLNNTHNKIDKFGVFRENTVITRKMGYIYLYFFFMLLLYLYFCFYNLLGFAEYNLYDLNLYEIWLFCWFSTALNYFFYTFCILKELDKIELLYRTQFFILTFLVAFIMYKYRFCVICVFSFLFFLEVLFIFIFSWSKQLGLLEEYPMLLTNQFRNFFVKKLKKK